MVARTTTRGKADKRDQAMVFAEDNLGLTAAWQELDDAQPEVERLLNHKSMVLGSRAEVQRRLQMIESEVLTEIIAERAKLAESGEKPRSLAAEEREREERLLAHEDFQKQRAGLHMLEVEVLTVENDLRGAELRHRAAIGKLASISSYLGFLTSARDARTTREQNIQQLMY